MLVLVLSRACNGITCSASGSSPFHVMGVIGCERALPPRRRIIRNYVTLRLNLAEHIVLRTIVICGIVYECYL